MDYPSINNIKKQLPSRYNLNGRYANNTKHSAKSKDALRQKQHELDLGKGFRTIMHSRNDLKTHNSEVKQANREQKQIY